jgi:signal transduction histidine kinase
MNLRSILTFLEPRSIDEDAGRREYILNIILAGSIFMTLICDGLVLYYALDRGMHHPGGISFWEFSLLPAFFIFLYACSRRGRFVLASYLLVIAYFLGNSYAAYRWGVNVPTILVGYALFIVMTTILISARSAFFLTIATAAVVFSLWWHQLNGIIFKEAENFTLGDGVALVVLYGLITLVAWLASREIDKSLLRARRSERALKAERDSLEITVEERTRALRAAEMDNMDHIYRFAEFGRLASGLFHDLLNVVNALTLRMEAHAGVMDDAGVLLEDARDTHEQIAQFKEALRKQLSHRDITEEFLLADAVEHAIQFLSYQAKQAGIDLYFHEEMPRTIRYSGNPLKFHQILMNLIVNAIESFAGRVSQAAGDKKYIRVQLYETGAEIVMSIEDNGCGIALSLLPKIYGPFFTTKTGQKNGIGIGLAITKRIVEEDFHGYITATSRMGEGSCFTVILPKQIHGSETDTSGDYERRSDDPRSVAS